MSSVRPLTRVFWPHRDNHEQLTQFIIYERPADYPDGYVVRQWIIRRGEKPIRGHALGGPDLESVRATIPPEKVRMDRSPEDDPTIFEVWI